MPKILLPCLLITFNMYEMVLVEGTSSLNPLDIVKSVLGFFFFNTSITARKTDV